MRDYKCYHVDIDTGRSTLHVKNGKLICDVCRASFKRWDPEELAEGDHIKAIDDTIALIELVRSLIILNRSSVFIKNISLINESADIIQYLENLREVNVVKLYNYED